jgi:acetoin:2,6-dichlorophenolindophenol oxidoreductase subunit alpha
MNVEVLYASMLRIRLFEEAAYRLFMQNSIEGSIHLYNGQEAIAVGVCSALVEGDTISATYRGHGACLAKGTSAERLFAEMLGRSTGTNGGRGGSMNVIDLEHGVIGCFGIVGGSIAAGTGAALAAQLMRTNTVTAAFFGDGAVNQAYFHECLNWAAIRKLPVVYVCENNQYGEFTPWRSVTGGNSIVGRGLSYGIDSFDVDGNNVLAVCDAAGRAVTRARAGAGPSLLVCDTYRHKGHSRHDDPRRYRPTDEVERWLARDPLTVLEGQVDRVAAARIRQAITDEIDAALAAAQAAPGPDPTDDLTATKEAAWRN